MNVFSEIEAAVSKEFDKLKEKLETLRIIKELESEIEKLKVKLEGSTDVASAINTAQANTSTIVNNAKPTLDAAAVENQSIAQ